VALAAASCYPHRFAVMGRFPAEDQTRATALPGWCAPSAMLGIRLVLHAHPWRTWFDRGMLEWFWPAAQALGIPIMVYAPGRMGQFSLIASRFPALRLIMDHLAIPLGAHDDTAFAGLPDLLRLARYSNIAVKASALPCHTCEAYPFSRLHMYLRRSVDAFGPRRVFWGSDLTRLPCSYRQSLDLFAEALDFLSGEDRDWILGDALAEWLGWSWPGCARGQRP
jgi:predicted TIM-barrel fold metal-dependent hydrolase